MRTWILPLVGACLLSSTTYPQPSVEDLPRDVAMVVRAYVAWTAQDSAVVDLCSLQGRMSVEERLGAVYGLGSVRIADCNESDAQTNATRFTLTDDMAWYGGRTRSFAVDVHSGHKFHRQQYTVTDGQVTEIALTAFGFLD